MGQLNVVAAFDMQDPAQVAALHDLLQFTPVEKAQHRVSAAYREVMEFARRHMAFNRYMAFQLDNTIPADLGAAKAEILRALMAKSAAARAALANVKAAQAIIAASKAA